MKQIIYIFIFFTLSCKAQEYSLNKDPFDIPSNSYLKDLNNELTPYVGTWEANFQNKNIRLLITKELKQPFNYLGKNIFEDVIIVRYEIKDLNGSILESSMNKDFSTSKKLRIKSGGTNLANNEVQLVFAGGNCSVGIGKIILKKINDTQFYWSYYPGTTTRNDTTCPPNLDYNIYLPETENLVFTKQ